MTDEKNETATAAAMRAHRMQPLCDLNLRRRRAQALTSALMLELDDIIPAEHRRHVYDRMLDLFYTNGAALLTDEDRRQLGLEPRDDLGWTPSERLLEKQRELDARYMMMMPAMMHKPAGS